MEAVHTFETSQSPLLQPDVSQVSVLAVRRNVVNGFLYLAECFDLLGRY
jgi:hypothetical protein